MLIKTLDELKNKYNNDVDKIKDAKDMCSLAINYIRIVYWKKVREHDYLLKRDSIIILPIIKDIIGNGFDVAKLKVKKGDLHKAQNAKYLYNYYGFNFELDKNTKINELYLIEEINKLLQNPNPKEPSQTQVTIPKVSNTFIEDDDKEFQIEMYSSDFNDIDVSNYHTTAPDIIINKHITLKRNVKVSKAAIRRNNFTCCINDKHESFTSTQGVKYMEGHHLIPCNVENVKYYWYKYNVNIDCIENIVTLCPNGHKAIHLATEIEKVEFISNLYYKKIKDLESIDINITLEELVKLY